MFDLATFGLTDLLEVSSAVRHVGRQASDMETAARSVVRYFYEHLLDKETDRPALALARFYKTHPYDRLEPELQRFVTSADPTVSGPTPCLVLLATAGELPVWNDRRASVAHRAIPLPSAQAVAQSPMIAQLVNQFGIDVQAVVAPDPALFRRLDEASYRVFYVPEARGSEHVPAQEEFVVGHGVRSALGFGGVLPDGALFAVVLFSKVPIAAETADAFASVAPAVKLAVLPFVEGAVFDSDARQPTLDTAGELRLARSQAGALEQLLRLRHLTVVQQSMRLEQAVEEANERAEELARSQAALRASEARKTAILETALDCIITMDDRGRIVEFNPAAEATFGYRRDQAVGQQLSEMIIPPELRPRHAAGLAHHLTTGEGSLLNRRVEITGMRSDGSELPVELAVTRVDLPGGPMFTGYLRDVTARLQTEAALLESRERFAHIARTLQESLLPPSLPEVPGVAMAAWYHPAGAGEEVGGDFYDVFEVGRDDWTLVLGDVCGKGPEAAALTALARYTLRAAAIRTPEPEGMLGVLNEAILRQHPERFCTVVCCRVRRSARKVRLAVASGGHLPPLVINPDGSVSEIPVTGLLLGVFDDWDGTPYHAALAPGATVILFSDGIIETGAGVNRFGLLRLKEILEDSAALSVDEIVDRIQRTVLEFSPRPSDDMALLVARALP